MKYKPYPAYKDSGVEWLGEVPELWKIIPLKHAVTMKSGEQITSDDIHEAGSYPVFGGNGLRGYTERFTHEGRFPLVGRQGALCGNVNYASGQFWASEHAIVVSPKRDCAVTWLGELLRSMNLGQYSITAAQPGLSVEVIGNLRIPYPSEREQTAIATFLDRETTKLDTLIAKQAKLLELLQEKRQALISHAVTKGLNPDVPMKDSGVGWLGEVPAHWDVVRLGILFREVSESGNDELPVLRVSIHDGVSDREFDEEELDRKVTRSEDRSKYKRVEPGDLVYNMMRAWQGGFGAVTVPGMVSPAYVVARPREPLRTDFIEQLLRTPQAVEKLRCHSYGVADFRLRLYWDEFKSIEIAIPPLSEQEQIMASISGESGRIDTLTEKSRRSIELMREHRTALISAAVTGKIDVREAS